MTTSTAGSSGLAEPLLSPEGSDTKTSTEQQASYQAIQQTDAERADGSSAAGAAAGERQEAAFRDLWAAILFVAHQVAIFYFAFAWGLPGLRLRTEDEDTHEVEDDEKSFGGIFYLCLQASVVALVFSTLSMSVLMNYTGTMIHSALIMCLVVNVGCIIYLIVNQLYVLIPFCAIFLVLGLCYGWSIWRRIPFAAANLKAALTAVKTNGGVVLVTYLVTAIVNAWTMVWVLAIVGVYVKKTLNCSFDDDGGATCSEEAENDDERRGHIKGLVFFLLSFFWTAQVGKNSLQVIVSGVVGTWWFEPTEASRCCSPATCDSCTRAVTYSFGSICFGSLLSAIVDVVYQMCSAVRDQLQDTGNRCAAMILCPIECILRYLENIVEYFNKWAFTYVGLYGYDYMTAGKKTITLFKHRGWTTIVNDSLVLQTLSLMSFMVGILTGCVGILLTRLHPRWMEGFEGTEIGDGEVEITDVVVLSIAFFIPFAVGTAICYILMSAVASAVDTVVICFAEAPQDLQRNHPDLYEQMMEAWRLVYPDEFTGH